MRAAVSSLLQDRDSVPSHDSKRDDGRGGRVPSEDLRVGMAAARASDWVSEGVVLALRAQVQDGRYRPAAEAVAEQILQELAAWRAGRRPRGAPGEG